MTAMKACTLALAASWAIGVVPVYAAGMPAARVTDLVASPYGPPGPILPPGEPTVLIEGLPAARVGDQALCAQPIGLPGAPVLVPEPIVTGSFTVLIGGMPAARTGDVTAGAGGCTIQPRGATVLIGG